ncbi:Cytoplasmic dynein 2 heavy chain 1 [Nucella lapillus]
MGWTKFYEFSLSDLRAGADIIDRLCVAGKEVPWNFIHGLYEFAIYGGRVDNVFDLRVLVSYLHQFFESGVINDKSKNKRLGPMRMPISANIEDYQEAIEGLPEFDKPSYFGLPENIERSAQRIISAQVISQLRTLQRADTQSNRFDKEVWAVEMGPVLSLWKKLNQGSNLIQTKIAVPTDKSGTQSPTLAFLLLEQYNGIKLVQSVHASLSALSKVIRGTQLLTSDVQKLAASLLEQETPMKWLGQWDGPDDPVQYLKDAHEVARSVGRAR